MSRAQTLIDNGVMPAYHGCKVSMLGENNAATVENYLQHVATEGSSGKGLYFDGEDPETVCRAVNIAVRGLLLSGVDSQLIAFPQAVLAINDDFGTHKDFDDIMENQVLAFDMVQYVRDQECVFSEREMMLTELFVRRWLRLEKDLIIGSIYPAWDKDKQWWSHWILGLFKDRLTGIHV